MKKCTKCKSSKIESSFHKDKSTKDGRVSICKQCKSEYRKAYYQKDPEKFRDYSRDWHKEHPDLSKEIQKRKREKNPDYYKKKRKEQYWSDPDTAKEQNKNYARERARLDPVYRLKLRCRKRIWAAFKEGGYSKRSTSFDLIGCDINKLMRHIESQFKPDMSWDNYGQWHVDHIIPLASAKNEDDVQRLCHYTNLQPLWAEENIRKGARVDYGNHKAAS